MSSPEETPLPVSEAPGDTAEAAPPAPAPAAVKPAALKPALSAGGAKAYALATAAEAKALAAGVDKARFEKEQARFGEVVTALAGSEVVKLGGPKASAALRSAAPALGGAAAAVSLALPFLLLAVRVLRDAAAAARSQLPPGALPLAWGVLLCFFGGQFVTLLAAVEAYDLCAGGEATAAVRAVATDASAVLSAASADEAKDAGAGGAPVPASLLLRRKALLLARMTAPEAVTGAALKLWVSYCGVLAVLKLRSARRAAMSLAVSDALAPVVARHALPALDGAVSPELRKWNATALSLALKAAVLLAFMLFASAADAVASALRGGQLAARHGLALLARRGLLKATVDDKLVHAVALALAAAGVATQAAAFKVPFPLSMLTWPVGLADWAVRHHIGATGRGLA